MKQYKILHILTGSYVCFVLDYSQDSPNNTTNKLITDWLEGKFRCSFYVNESYIINKNKIIISNFTNKKLLKELIKHYQFLHNIDIDLNQDNGSHSVNFKYKASPEEFEIIEVADV